MDIHRNTTNCSLNKWKIHSRGFFGCNNVQSQVINALKQQKRSKLMKSKTKHIVAAACCGMVKTQGRAKRKLISYLDFKMQFDIIWQVTLFKSLYPLDCHHPARHLLHLLCHAAPVDRWMGWSGFNDEVYFIIPSWKSLMNAHFNGLFIVLFFSEKSWKLNFNRTHSILAKK